MKAIQPGAAFGPALVLCVALAGMIAARPLPAQEGTADGAGAAAGAIRLPRDFDREELLAMLHSGHPRLFATASDWARIRRLAAQDRYLGIVRDHLNAAAAELMVAPPLEYELEGRRLLSISRGVLKRVLTLGSLYRLTGERQYLQRARAEALHAAAFPDWNPSHFLDTAEMTLAVSVAYDWLFDDLTESDRAVLRRAIRDKGLAPGLGPPEGLNYWKLKTNNWIQVCYTGLVAGALAIAEDEPDVAVELLTEMASQLPNALTAYLPDGAYPEGPGYWSYGTHFTVMLISLLESALGDAWNLDAFRPLHSSAVYINVMVGPSGRYFNYSDSGDTVGLLPALHWFAARARNPSLDARERERLIASEGSEAFYPAEGATERFFPLALHWIDPELQRAPAASRLPLHWKARGSNPVAVHRSSWDDDALFLGVKGGSPSANHGHMDIGSFVLDWNGVRWSSDLRRQSYHSLESLGLSISGYEDPGSDRWRVFHYNNYSHNTLLIGNRQMRIDGFAPIVTFSDASEDWHTVVDMTEVYREFAESALRGFRHVGDGSVLIHDEFSGLPAATPVRWGMVTEAAPEIRSNSAVLRQDGKALHARIVEPAEARFTIVPTDPPPNAFDAPNPGTRMLAIQLETAAKIQHIRVVLSPALVPDAFAETLRLQPPPSRW